MPDLKKKVNFLLQIVYLKKKKGFQNAYYYIVNHQIKEHKNLKFTIYP